MSENISQERQVVPEPDARFIKLGGKGDMDEESIYGTNPCIWLGYESGQHAECLRGGKGDWEAVYDYWLGRRNNDKGQATRDRNQIKDFYTLPESTVWITFYNRKLYWCRASKIVTELPDGSRIRKTIEGWSSEDINGKELYIDNLSGKLTKVQGFRGTICKLGDYAKTYLFHKLNGGIHPNIKTAQKALGQLEQALKGLIQGLDWKDFELLTDMIFSKMGWQRISSLWKAEKHIDLDLMSPVTHNHAFVQVKSQADLNTFRSYEKAFAGMNQYSEMYFVVHSPNPDITGIIPIKGPLMGTGNRPIWILTEDRLAKLVVSAGLTDWLIWKMS